MHYSVWADVSKLVEQAKHELDWKRLYEITGSSGYVSEAERDWDEFTFGGSFYGGGTNEVISKFLGPHEYEAKVIANIERQLENENFFRKKFVFKNRQIQGQRVDIPRYLNGDQRYWFSVKKVPMPNRAVRLFAPMGGIARVSQSEMAVCGALTCAVCEALESNGINVELWACCCVGSVANFHGKATDEQRRFGRSQIKNCDLCQLVKIKDSSQYCDYGMINYITGDSGFYRNIIFKDRICALMNTAESTGMYYSNCGCSYNFTRECIPKDEDYNSEADIVIPRIYNIDEAKYWLNENLDKAIANVNELAERGEEEQQ